MAVEEKNSSINTTARVAGFLYLMIAIFGIVSLMFGPESLIVQGDAAATANNIQASETAFRLAFIGDLIGQVFFIFVALLLYKILNPVNKNWAVVMVVLVLVGIPIAMLNLLNQLAALLLLSGADYLAIFASDQLHAQVRLYLDLYESGLRIAYIFWGLWLFPLGYLIFKSGFIPKFVGILLIIACFGYLIDAVTFFLLPNFDASVRMFTFWGELVLALWLLIKGVNVDRWEQLATETD